MLWWQSKERPPGACACKPASTSSRKPLPRGSRDAIRQAFPLGERGGETVETVARIYGRYRLRIFAYPLGFSCNRTMALQLTVGATSTPPRPSRQYATTTWDRSARIFGIGE